MHSRSKHCHMIDFIIVPMWVTRAMRGAECWASHRLVRAVLTLHIAPPHKNLPKTVRASYNVAGLKNPIRLAQFLEALDEKLQDGLTSETSFRKNGFPSRIQSPRRQRKSLDQKPERMKTGSTRMTRRSEKPSMPRTSLTSSGRMTRPLSPSVRDSRPSRQKSSPIFD